MNYFELGNVVLLRNSKFTKTSVKLFSWYENFWRCYPFYFREEEYGYFLHRRKDFVGRIIFPLIQIILCCYYVFISFGLYLNWNAYLKKGEYFELAFHTAWLFGWGNGASIEFHLRCALNSLPSLYNQTLNANRRLSEKLGNAKYEAGWKLNNILQIVVAFYMFAIPGFSALLFILLRNKPWYYFHLLPDCVEGSYVAVIIYAVYDYWSIAVHLAAFGVQMWVAVAFMGTVTVTLKFLRREIQPQCRLDLGQEANIYCQLFILNSRFNECFANSLIPCFKVSCGASFILCTAGLIKLEGVGPPACLGALGTVALFGANMLLGIGISASMIEKGTERFISFLKRNKSNTRFTKEEVRIRNSIRVFGVKILGVYSMDRKAPLTMISIASTYIVSILVIFPQKLSISGQH